MFHVMFSIVCQYFSKLALLGIRDVFTFLAELGKNTVQHDHRIETIQKPKFVVFPVILV